jgi:hypothetical protein
MFAAAKADLEPHITRGIGENRLRLELSFGRQVDSQGGQKAVKQLALTGAKRLRLAAPIKLITPAHMQITS